MEELAPQAPIAKLTQGTMEQLQNCKSVYDAYFAMRGRKFEF